MLNLRKMMKWSIGRKIALGFAGAVLTLLLFNVTAYVRMSGVLSVAEGRRQTQAQIEALNDLLILLPNLQNAARGFLLSPQEPFRTTYDKAAADVSAKLEELRRLSEPDIKSFALFKSLEPLVNKEVAIFEQMVQARQPAKPMPTEANPALHEAEIILQNITTSMTGTNIAFRTNTETYRIFPGAATKVCFLSPNIQHRVKFPEIIF